MRIVNVTTAVTCLDELLEEAAEGAEVVITRTNGMAFKITPLKQEQASEEIEDFESLPDDPMDV